MTKNKMVTQKFYPNHFKDFILLELIRTQKQLKLKEIYERDFVLNEEQILIVLRVVESRLLKEKINFLSSLLTQ